jgi:hypothetical protein
MLQIKTFKLPDEETAANEFLATHKPFGEIARMGDLLFVAVEDGSYPVEYEIAWLAEYLQGVREAKLQQEVALYVMQAEMADLGNKKAADELSVQVKNLKDGIAKQDMKVQFLENRIAALRNGQGNGTGDA